MARQNQVSEDNDEPFEEIAWPEIFKNPQITKAINTAVSAWANNVPRETNLRYWSLFLSISFSGVVLLAIGGLGYLNVLSKDVTGSLIGSLIGYWFGRYQTTKN